MPDAIVNHVRIHYEDTGSGAETVVFSHGLLWSGSMFDAQVAALRDQYRCVAYDHRGQGKSEVTRDGYDMDTLTDDAAALITALGAAPCHFVGLSMGGFVGMRLAARRPELLRSLTLLNTAADPEPRTNVPRYRAMVLGARVLGFGPFVEPVMKIMFGRRFLEDPDRGPTRALMRARLAGVDVVGASRSTEAVVTRRAIEHELERIRVPTLVLAGQDDRAIARPRSQRTAERIPGAHYVQVPHAGHTSTVEEPEAINAELRRFLASVASAHASGDTAR